MQIVPSKFRQILSVVGMVLFFQVVLSLGLCNGLLVKPWAEQMTAGVAIAGSPVAGLTREQAIDQLRQQDVNLVPENFLILEDGSHYWSLPYQSIEGIPDYVTAVELSYQMSKGEGWGQRIFKAWQLYWKPVDLPVPIVFSVELLRQRLELIAKEYDQGAQDARLVLEQSEVVLVPSQLGHKLDIEGTISRVEKELYWGRKESINLVMTPVQPRITVVDLNGINAVNGLGITKYDSKQTARTNNLFLAARSMDGTLLQPEEVFSFYERVGPRSAERGYQKAKMFANGKVTYGTGGGVCQVSTTLYIAVLQSGLKVEERYPHSRPVNYASVGQDASVLGEEADFKFKNSSLYPLYISAEIVDDRLIVRIFGVASDVSLQMKVITEKEEIAPQVLQQLDSSLPEGATVVVSPGRQGYRAKVYRITEKQNEVIDRELISTDYYAPEDRVIRVGDFSVLEDK
jgi:vancomycin resistance protein YoaR